MRYPQLGDREWLTEEYVVKRQPASEISRQIGCNPATVYRALRDLGIEIRPKGRATRAWRGLEEYDEPRVVQLYREGMSANQLGRMFHASPHTIIATLDRHGVERRGRREAAIRRRDTTVRRRQPPRALVARFDKCAVCDHTELLECHHLNADPTDNRPENLVALCWEHHMFVEFLILQALCGLRDQKTVA